jgi:hypothetical protein
LKNAKFPPNQSSAGFGKLHVRRLAKICRGSFVDWVAGLQNWQLDRIAPDAIREGKGYFEELRQRQVDPILAGFEPTGNKGLLRSQLSKVVSLVPEREPIGAETLGASVECRANGVCIKEIILEYKYPDRRLLFKVTISIRSGHFAIADLYVEPSRSQLYPRSDSRFVAKAGSTTSCARSPSQRRPRAWRIRPLYSNSDQEAETALDYRHHSWFGKIGD